MLSDANPRHLGTADVNARGRDRVLNARDVEHEPARILQRKARRAIDPAVALQHQHGALRRGSGFDAHEFARRAAL